MFAQSQDQIEGDVGLFRELLAQARAVCPLKEPGGRAYTGGFQLGLLDGEIARMPAIE